MTKYIALTTVGEMLSEEFIKPYKLSQNALAKALNIPTNRIHQIVKGQRKITADTDLRLSKFFGMSNGFFLRFQEDYDLRKTKREIANQIDMIKPIVSDVKTEIRV
ncbi:MAG: HigA family addiction module antitoxin [Alphaproteobacteria bacterium]